MIRTRSLHPRRSADATRRRIGVTTGVVLVLAAGFAIGRGSRASTATSVAPALAPSTAVTAPATLPASPPNETQSGAVTAAATMDCTLGGRLVVDPTRYQGAIAALLAPDKVGSAAAIASAESAQLDAQTGAVSAAAQGERVAISCIPLAYRVETYTASTATVSVWSEQIVAVDRAYAPASAYITETLSLRWMSGGWKLETSTLLDTQWAPVPVQTGLPQTSALPAQLLDFTPFEAG